MKRHRWVVPVAVCVGLTLVLFLVDPPGLRGAPARSETPPMGVTGAPAGPGAPAEGTCNQVGCHGGGVNTGDGSFAVFASGLTYTPGQAETLAVTLSDPGQSRWGFEVTALKADGSMAGSFELYPDAAAFTLIQTNGTTGRSYVSHTSNANNPSGEDGTFAGIPTGPVGWLFIWNAPPAGAGTVTFYAAGNAANNNGLADANDFIYTSMWTLTEETGTAVSRTTWGAIKTKYR